MKKSILSIIAIILIFASLLTSCNSENKESENTTSESESVLLQNTESHFLEVALLGGFESFDAYSNAEISEDFPEELTYLFNLSEDAFIDASDGFEVFALIPYGEGTKIKVNKLVYSDDMMTSEKSELLYESESTEPVVLKCNVSDLFSDTIVTVTKANGESISYSPSTSLKDGSVFIPEELAEFVISLTPSEEEA